MSGADIRPPSGAHGPKTVMIVGLGKLGGPVLDILATRFPTCRFVCVGRNAETLLLRANLSRYLAAQWGSYPDVVTAPGNLLNVDAMATCLGDHRPDIVFNATTPFPWWRIAEFPPAAAARAEAAGPGMWCALDCILPLRLSEAMSISNVEATYVNACYPDLTNAFLSGLAGAPNLGVGNANNLVAGLKLAFAEELGISALKVGIRLVAHHYISWNAPKLGGAGLAPFHLTVTHPDGKLIFEGPDDRCFDVLRRRATRVRGLEGLGVTIGSAATVLAELMDGAGRILHCPGALGLPGGYPVRISHTGQVALDLDFSLTVERAVEINRSAQRFDGTERVEGGVIVPTENSREAFAEITGEPLPDVSIDNVYDLARCTLERLNACYQLELEQL